jgi:hypothetical protein
LLRNQLPRLLKTSESFNRNALAIALVLGVMTRLAWAVIFHPVPMSDGATYLDLSRRLLGGEGAHITDALSYWPPGYVFFLSIFLAAFPAKIAVPLSQITLFAVAAIGVYRLARLLSSNSAATVAVFLFALWPNLLTLCATPEKEMLVTTCLVWAANVLLATRPASLLLAGLLFGYAALVQPSTQLLIPTALVFLVLRHRTCSWRLLTPLLLGAALVIAPWTVRNYVTLGGFKLISTNGGDNLYRANNPLATGGYTERGELDFSTLPVLERDGVAKEKALSWIKTHPVRFAELIVEKQLRFMGDDSYGVYATFRGEGSGRNTTIYTAGKLIATVWWLAAWLLVASIISRGERLGQTAFLIWGWLYFFSLHSVFESNGKYHVPVLWILCICLGDLVARVGANSVPNFPNRAPIPETEPTMGQ